MSAVDHLDPPSQACSSTVHHSDTPAGVDFAEVLYDPSWDDMEAKLGLEHPYDIEKDPIGIVFKCGTI